MPLGRALLRYPLTQWSSASFWGIVGNVGRSARGQLVLGRCRRRVARMASTRRLGIIERNYKRTGPGILFTEKAGGSPLALAVGGMRRFEGCIRHTFVL